MSKGLVIMNAVADEMSKASKAKKGKPATTNTEPVVDGNAKEQGKFDGDPNDGDDAPTNGPKKPSMDGKRPPNFGKKAI